MISAALLTLILTAATVMPPATQSVFLARFERQYDHAVKPVYTRQERVDEIMGKGWMRGSDVEKRLARDVVGLEAACRTTSTRLQSLTPPYGFAPRDTQTITQWIRARQAAYRARCATVPLIVAYIDAPVGNDAIASERLTRAYARERRADQRTPRKATRGVWQRANRKWPADWV